MLPSVVTLSLDSFNRVAPHLALSFTTLPFLKIQVSYFLEGPSIWVRLLFSHGEILVLCFWQDYPGRDAVAF